MTQHNQRIRTLDIVYIGIFAALIVICTWISIPTLVPFTLQTFAVFLSVSVLGGKRGSLAVLIYLLLGILGLPVFSGFRGGIGVLFNTTGGYLVGFLFSALFMWAMEKLLGKKTWVLAFSMVSGLLLCYLFGTIWFMVVYTHTNAAIGIVTILSWCVFPFIIPDAIKILLALLISKPLRKIMKTQEGLS